jgi:hypothetical protein
MYIVAIAWMYVVLMMSVAEATNANGTLLGAIVTFILYGVLPVSLVVYLMRSPTRKRAIKAKEAELAESARLDEETHKTDSLQPDTTSHAPTATQTDSVSPVREVP